MNSIEEKIALLTVRIQDLASQQNVFKAKLLELMQELDLLKALAAKEKLITGQAPEASSIKTEIPEPVVNKVELPPVSTPPVKPVSPFIPVQPEKPAQQKEMTDTGKPLTAAKDESSNLEEFLGKNLASKVGILVTVIGIFIGAKYAIEHDLISRQVRIMLGYLSGLVLVGLGLRLKKKYPAYSAVLLGGGLCVCYFITYIAFTYYQMFPRMVAFGIMVAVTAAIVYGSLLYNRVIIAHLAQVGAYAIPFLLSDNSGNYSALFSYIAIINAGMLVISLKKYWKSLLYAAFGITWFIFVFWFGIVSDEERFSQVAWFFLSLYFALFYASFLIYKLVRKEKFYFGDVLLLIPNAFLFFGLGLYLLNRDEVSGWGQGGFTVLNALIHGAVAFFVSRIIGKNNHLFGLLIGLVITFMAIAVPVTFDGKAITLLWAAEAVILYLLGRKWETGLYLNFSIALITLGLCSLCFNYAYEMYKLGNFHGKLVIRPDAFLNGNFYTAFLVLGASFGLIFLHRNKYRETDPAKTNFLHAFYDILLPAAAITLSYFVLFLEISRWFNNIRETMRGADGSFGPWDQEVRMAQILALLLYSFVFVLVLTAINHRWIKSIAIRGVSFGVFMILLIFWALIFLRILNIQTVNYFEKDQTGLYFGSWNLFNRYLMLLPIAGLLYYFQPKFSSESNRNLMKVLWPQLIVVSLILFLSFEYLLWTKVSGANNQYTYGLSILWGLYALALIAYGIWKKHRGVRYSAMIMLVITLLKVTVFDLSHANTLTRTISYIALGGILLLISYLYNRYKDLLFGKDEPSS
ncbi:DUF2339 domain-containing protein [Pseudobacter ginsenosidimutans]|uniref:Putative membrane protein DUF2339 n=1 Tax=Pseudobacter ginsenosidimutans TaxID=661488 RepID=A0A4V2F080_9BACT|nr:DUF2339 domain-containing protein [Pseudobacter ginsenosidimutans]QEC40337.1 DUF2339 domain-containing protein [Pseudobacter ginsenosidimutans]RZS69060.1 putative membrane protein DUF2339 [Pseudobacter ginsenosidimutans]